MKKKLALLATALLLSSMTACGQQTIEGDLSPQYIAVNRDFYENGVIYPRKWRTAYFLDFDTMERSPLCAVPNCTHQTASCLTTSLGNTPVLYNQNVFFFTTKADVRETPDGSEFYMDTKLCKASLDSSAIKTVCTFHDAMPRDGEGYVLYGSELYFIAFDPDAKDDGFGGFPWSTSGGYDYLCSIDLDSGEYTNHGLICYVEDEYPSADNTATAKILGCDNEKLYIGYSFAKEYPQDYRGEYDLDWVQYNFTFDFSEKEIKESSLPYAAYIDADTYVYYEDDAHFTVIRDGEAQHLNGLVGEFYAPVFHGKVFGIWNWYDLSDGSEHSLGKYVTSDEDEWRCIAYYDGYYIFQRWNNEFVKLTEEELKAL